MEKKEQPIIVGLDIGTTKVVAIAGRKNEYGKLEILGFGLADSAGIEHGVVLNIERCIQSIEMAMINCLKSKQGLEVKEVYVGIAGQHIKSIQTRGDRVRINTELEISREDIEALIKDQKQTYIPAGDKIIDIVPQDFTVDSATNIVDPIGMSGVKIGANFHIITADRNAVKNIMKCVDKASLKTRDLILQPLASAAAVMNDEDLEAGVAIVDIGGGTTDMAVFYDGILKHTAVIPYAGLNITNDIKNGLCVLRNHAEILKTKYGMALANEAPANAYITVPGLRGMPPKEISAKGLSQIIQARMEEILSHVMHHLQQVGLERKLFGGIILTGGGAQLKHITQLTEFVTGIYARVGLPNEHLAAGGYSETLSNPMFSTCIGLILRGYSDWENGRMKNGNYIRLNDTEIVPETLAETETTPVPQIEEEIQATERVKNRNNRNAQVIKTMFSGLRDKFMHLFDELEDKEI